MPDTACKFIGIDQSFSSTGLVVLNWDGSIYRQKLLSTPVSKDWVGRAIKIANTLMCEIAELSDNADVGIEGLGFGARGDATRNLAGLQFLIIDRLRSILPSENIVVIAPTTLKKFATDSGKADKQQVFDALPDDVKKNFIRWGKTKGRFDLTDAYWLAERMRKSYRDEL